MDATLSLPQYLAQRQREGNPAFLAWLEQYEVETVTGWLREDQAAQHGFPLPERGADAIYFYPSPEEREENNPYQMPEQCEWWQENEGGHGVLLGIMQKVDTVMISDGDVFTWYRIPADEVRQHQQAPDVLHELHFYCQQRLHRTGFGAPEEPVWSHVLALLEKRFAERTASSVHSDLDFARAAHQTVLRNAPASLFPAVSMWTSQRKLAAYDDLMRRLDTGDWELPEGAISPVVYLWPMQPEHLQHLHALSTLAIRIYVFDLRPPYLSNKTEQPFERANVVAYQDVSKEDVFTQLFWVKNHTTAPFQVYLLFDAGDQKTVDSLRARLRAIDYEAVLME